MCFLIPPLSAPFEPDTSGTYPGIDIGERLGIVGIIAVVGVSCLSQPVEPCAGEERFDSLCRAPSRWLGRSKPGFTGQRGEPSGLA